MSEIAGAKRPSESAPAAGPGRRTRRDAAAFNQPPWRRLANPYAPIEVLTEEQLDRLHDASMRILETHGLEFLSDAALDILARAGADVDRGSRRVRFDRA